MPFLKRKRILVTAGPTWVPIDSVRAITNVFGGALGITIAECLSKVGADVVLLLGPGRAIPPKENGHLKVIRFKYFDDLLRLMKEHVGSRRYDAVIHSAAVADYAPEKASKGKIKSGKSELVIRLKPTVKIVDMIKDIDPDIFLVKFKLEVGTKGDRLVGIARKSMEQSRADLIVANEFSETGNKHRAFIIDADGKTAEYLGKENIARALSERLLKNKK
jgi:phosphopantothenoylcysteine decarboxylase/phosphopantothenate--cysteine ligase